MDPNRMTIALVASSYHPHFGGVEEHVRHVARELQSRGHAVEVWTVDRGDGLRDEVVDGCWVRYLPTPMPARSPRAIVSLILRAPGALTQWVRAYASFHPDVLNVQCFGPNGVYGLALATVTRTPLVVSSHGETFGDEHGVFDKSALLRASLRQAVKLSTVTACSSLVATDLRSRFGATKVHVIPNGVDSPLSIDRITPAPRTASRPILIGVGRLVRQKGFDVLLEAAARSRHEPQVWLVGDGAERPRLEALASDLAIFERVTFFGRQDPEEVHRLMGEADAVVVPSRVEAFGMVVLEAWAAGTPVLATSRGGPAGLITDHYDGLLIDPEDLPSVLSGIDRVLGDREWAGRMAIAGRKTARSFSWARVTDNYCRLYDNTANTHSSSPTLKA